MQFSELQFTAKNDGNGTTFEANATFENHWQVMVTCGMSVMTSETIDETPRASAAEYSLFEYKIFDGVNEQLDDGNWIGGQSQANITAILQSTAANEAVWQAPVEGE